MIHFLPIPEEAEALPDDSELLARVAGLQRALRLVEPFGSGPSDDLDDLESRALLAAESRPAVARCIDRRSQRLVAAAAAGLEAVVEQRSAGFEPNDVSLDLLAREIQAGLADLSSLVRA